MRKLLFRFSLILPTIILVLSILFFGIKVCGMVKGASASQEETIVRALQESEKIKIFIYENFGDYKTYKKMVRIAECESGFNQSAVNRKSMDFGLFQVNEKTWDETAKSMGLDYKESWEDNILMARFIYQTQGYSAWGWSYQCHFVK